MISGKKGFTIVELLIVIVVIAILATIAVVAYNGIQSRAKTAQVLSAATQAAEQVALSQAETNILPTSLSQAGVTVQNGISYDYSVLNDTYCVSTVLTNDNAITAGSSGSGSCGLRAEYFNAAGGNFGGTPALSRQDRNINFDWGSGSPATSVRADNFSVRWNGFITPPLNTITLRTLVDDNIRVYLDNNAIINRWGTGCCNWVNTPDAFSSFTANQRIPIRVEYSEGGGGAGIRIHWNYPDPSTYVPVPSAAFSY